MNDMTQHVDDIVNAQIPKCTELQAIGQKIASSSSHIVVAFIHLAESTQLKQYRLPEQWPGYVFEFVNEVDGLARSADSTVAIRIGDEIMVTFTNTRASEKFVDSLTADKMLQTYRRKGGVYYGSAYHFRIFEHLAMTQRAALPRLI
jgi:class 3 adenylate cyclase